ncbi:hypothetical protein V8C42DRAFT_329261 [Trichoderma barbatum]
MYVGMWSKGAKAGHGKRTTSDGWECEGIFMNGKMEGPGTQKNKTGHSYSGLYCRGQPGGKGTWRFPNGDRRSTHTNGNKTGILHDRHDGSIYEGQLQRCNEPCKGKKTYKDGSVYEGWFLNNKRNGIGFYKSSSGMLYEGTWRDDVKEGFFTVTDFTSGFKKRCKF